MKCSNCESKMVLSDDILLSNPPKYKYECTNCCHTVVVDKVECTFTPIVQKPSFKLDWSRVKSFDELLLLLNEVDLYVTASHLKYDELMSKYRYGNINDK